MYTGRKVTRLIQPVAVCVVLVWGALPGVTLACEWACRGDAGSAHEHATHQHHSTDAPDTAAPAPAATSVASSERPCEHAAPSVTAVTTASVKVVAPVGIDVPRLELSVRPQVTTVAAADRGTHSPPGARSSPLPLRI